MFLVSEDKIVCPYCRHGHDKNGWGVATLSTLQGGERKIAILCGECRKLFNIKIETTYRFFSSEVE